MDHHDAEIEFYRQRLNEVIDERDENLRVLQAFRRRAWTAEDELAELRARIDQKLPDERERCVRCRKQATGWATINDRRYCHPDTGESCYQAALAERQAAGGQPIVSFAARTEADPSNGSYLAYTIHDPGIIGQGDTPLAARQDLIQALALANHPTCSADGHENLPAAGEAQAGDDDAWYPYCEDCLHALDGSYPTRRTAGQADDLIRCVVCHDATVGIITPPLVPAPPGQRIAADGLWCSTCIETWDRARNAEPT